MRRVALSSLVLLLLCFATQLACRRPQSDVLLWPSTAIQIKPGFSYDVNSDLQLTALRKANPLEDADASFQSGDYRLLSGRLAFPEFDGIPYDGRVDAAMKQYGYKVIAYNSELSTNNEFIRLRSKYASEFNVELYNLLETNGLPR